MHGAKQTLPVTSAAKGVAGPPECDADPVKRNQRKCQRNWEIDAKETVVVANNRNEELVGLFD